MTPTLEKLITDVSALSGRRPSESNFYDEWLERMDGGMDVDLAANLRTGSGFVFHGHQQDIKEMTVRPRPPKRKLDSSDNLN